MFRWQTGPKMPLSEQSRYTDATRDIQANGSILPGITRLARKKSKNYGIFAGFFGGGGLFFVRQQGFDHVSRIATFGGVAV